MAFGKQIKKLRDLNNISAAKTAERLDVKAERLRKWEQFDRDPQDDDITQIEAAFRMPMKQIMQLKELPEYLKSPNKKGTLIQDAGAMIINNQVEIISTQRVILSILAEVQSPTANRLPTELASIYRRMVKDEAEQVRSELKLKP